MPIWVTLLGYQVCIPRYTYKGRVSLADHVLPSLNNTAWAISETSMFNRDLQGYFTWVMSLNPLWEEVTPQCAPSKWKGTLSQCYPSPAVWVARGTTVVDLLFVEPGPIVCHIGRTRRPTQGAGGRSSCGALVGIPICRSQIPLHCKRTALPLSHRNTDIFIYLSWDIYHAGTSLSIFTKV